MLAQTSSYGGCRVPRARRRGKSIFPVFSKSLLASQLLLGLDNFNGTGQNSERINHGAVVFMCLYSAWCHSSASKAISVRTSSFFHMQALSFFPFFFFFFLFMAFPMAYGNSLGQGLNLSCSCNPSRHKDSAGSLTCCATGNPLSLLLSKLLPLPLIFCLYYFLFSFS